MVSAWATANQLSLGQVVVDEKSNEITAIPKLLEMLTLSGYLVTIDAMGCQTEIAEKIVDSGANYVLAVKGNQPTLHEGITELFRDHMEDNFARAAVRVHQTEERGHGREETRTHYVCPAPEDLPDRKRWKRLAAIGVVINHTVRAGKETGEVRYHIMSKRLPVRGFAKAVRGHWSVENRLHWQLDVTFGEDQARIRKGHADTNFSILRRTALSLLKNKHALMIGVKNRRLVAGWENDYLLQVMFGT
jgi:predicted transposase YbfD/YdcC